MARLNVAAKRPATPAQTRRPPQTADTSNSSDAEAASQQLLTEAASATKMPRSAAVDGANLLNAARVHPSKPALKRNNGKLSRPSILAREQPRRDLASRENPYDILSSPEKDSFSIPDKVNRRPIQVVKKTRKTSPPTQDGTVDQVKIVETHSSGDLRCTVVDWNYEKGRKSCYKQCNQLGLHDSDSGPRCKTHTQKPPVLRCGHTTTIRDTKIVQCQKPASIETVSGPRCASHAEQPARGGTRITQPQVRIPVRSRPNGPQESTSVAEDTSHVTQDNDDPTGAAELSTEPTLNRKKKGEKTRPVKSKTSGDQDLSPAKGKAKTSATTSSKSQSTGRKSKPKEQTSDLAENEASSLEENDTAGEQSDISQNSDVEGAQHDVHDVFKYLASKKCPGRCKTESATGVLQTCEVSQLLVQADNTSTDTIAEAVESLRDELNQTLADISEEDRPAFKGDAYAYIFRALISYLKAVYRWLDRKYDEVTNSLDAMRLLCTLTQVILTLKDTTYLWRVSAPPRSDGEMVIKSVDQKVIVPLRKVDTTFRTQLQHLQVQEIRRKQHAALKRKRDEEEEDDRRRADDESEKVERWRRWQNLHVLRMQLEPDAFMRRKRLMIQKPLAERDANGVIFERVPIFKARSSLVRHWISIDPDDRDWTDIETEALLDGLKDFAGPSVFEKIIRKHCHAPNGILRDFCVSNIFAKVASLHAHFVAIYQEREDWELPAYLAELPAVLAMYPSPL